MRQLEVFVGLGRLVGILVFSILSAVAFWTHDIDWIFRAFSAFIFYAACKELNDVLFN